MLKPKKKKRKEGAAGPLDKYFSALTCALCIQQQLFIKTGGGVRDAGVGGVSMRRQGYRSNLGQTGSGFHSPAAPAPLHPATPPPQRRSPWLCHECVSCTVHSSGLSYDWNEDMSAHSLYRLAFTFSAWILQQDSSGLFNCPELLLRLNEGRKWKGK